MKKHLIAAAVAAAVAAPAMAQNLTISGLLDSGYSQTKADVGTGSTKNSAVGFVAGGWSTSNITFSATEDLGGGLKAGVTISSFFESSSTSPGNATADAAGTALNTIGGRDRFLTLEGGFGKVQLGRYVPAINGYCAYACAGGTNNTAGTTDSSGSDLVNGTLGGRSSGGGATAVSTSAVAFTTSNLTGSTEVVNAAHMEHQSNVLEYTTPTMAGLNAVITYISNKADNSGELNADKATQQGIRVNYSAGPLALSVASATRKWAIEDASAAEQDHTKSTINWLGASYDLGAVKLFASHALRKDKVTDGTAAEAIASDIKVNTIGVQIPMGAMTFTASMYNGTDDATVSATDNRDLKGHQVTARYALSKRTSAYVAHGTNKDSRQNSSVTNNDFKRTQTNFGVVHSF